MQVIFTSPDEFGNSSNEMFRGQSHGFQQNQNQGNGLQQGGMQNQQGNGLSQGGLNQGRTQLNQNGSGEQPKRRGRGFASMDPARVSEIASMGGKAAHEQGVAHEWTPEEARRAGRKGGQASRGNSNNTQTASGGGSF